MATKRPKANPNPMNARTLREQDVAVQKLTQERARAREAKAQVDRLVEERRLSREQRRPWRNETAEEEILRYDARLRSYLDAVRPSSRGRTARPRTSGTGTTASTSRARTRRTSCPGAPPAARPRPT